MRGSTKELIRKDKVLTNISSHQDAKSSLVDVNLRLFDLVYLYLLGAMLNFLAANMPGLNNETYFERFSFHILLLNASKDIYYTF